MDSRAYCLTRMYVCSLLAFVVVNLRELYLPCLPSGDYYLRLLLDEDGSSRKTKIVNPYVPSSSLKLRYL